MDKKEIISGTVWLCISIAVLIASVHLGIGPFQNPGPGFLSFWASILLALLSGALLILSITAEEKFGSITALWKDREWPIPLLVAAAMIVYGLVLPELGYITSTFGLMTALFGAGKMNLRLAIPGALLTALLTFVLFDWLLKMPLPRGFFVF